LRECSGSGSGIEERGKMKVLERERWREFRYRAEYKSSSVIEEDFMRRSCRKGSDSGFGERELGRRLSVRI